MSGASEDPRDALARMRAALEQAMAGMRDLAMLLRAHFEGCREAGFSEEQALMLTLAYQAEFLRMAWAGGSGSAGAGEG